MFNSNGGYSLSDIAAVTGSNGNNGNNNCGWGAGDGAWWIIILFLFVFCGWGNNGNGWGNGNNGGYNGPIAQLQPALTRGELCQDMNFADLETAVRGVSSGICDGFYAMNTGMLNGFSGVQSTLCSGFAGINNAITTSSYESQLASNGLSSQLADCCCKTQSNIADLGYKLQSSACDLGYRLQDCCCTTQRAIDGVNYNMATNTNALQQALCNNTRDIIESNNANYRALHDEIVANRIEDKNAQIQAQQQQITALQLAASQAAQNNYLVEQLRPCPIPAYVVSNPFCCNNGYNGYNGIGYNNCCGGCGC